MIAIQTIQNGQVIDYCETKDQASWWLNNQPVEAIDTTLATKVEVIYTELGGPWGYGHQEPSFTTYGGLLKCIRHLINWMKSIANTFGPDPREIKDYFKHCRLYINGDDHSEWLWRQMNKVDIKTIFS